MSSPFFLDLSAGCPSVRASLPRCAGSFVLPGPARSILVFLALVSPSSPLNPPPSFLSLPRAKPIPQQPEAGARPGRVARGRRPEAGEQPQPQPVVDERRRTGRGRLEEARSEQEPGAQVRFLSPSSLCLVAVTVCSLEVVFRTFWSHRHTPPALLFSQAAQAEEEPARAGQGQEPQPQPQPSLRAGRNGVDLTISKNTDLGD